MQHAQPPPRNSRPRLGALLGRWYDMNSSSALRARLEAALPGLLFLLLFGLSGAAALWKHHETQSDAQTQVELGAQRISVDVSRRFRQAVYGLYGARGVYAASESVNRAAFRAYVESRNMPEELPGVRGLGFIQRVLPPDLDTFVATARADRAPRFALRQLSDTAQQDLLIIKFIEPAASNQGAMGLDIGSEPLRRSAAERAIDSGQATLTAPITLVQDEHKTPGVLLYVPVYAKGAHPVSVAERRAALVGLLYAPLVMEELLSGLPEVASGLMDIEVFDSTPGAAAALIYDSDNQGATRVVLPAPDAEHLFSTSQSMSLMGRELSVHVSSEPKFEAALDQRTPWLILAAGAAIAALLALYLRGRLRQLVTVNALVEGRTTELDRERLRLKALQETATDGIHILDATGLLVECNTAFLQMLGLDPSAVGKLRVTDWDTKRDGDLIHQSLDSLIKTQSSSVFESQNRRRDGSLLEVEISARGILIDGHGLVYCASRDITARKLHETASAELSRQVSQLNQRFSLAADSAQIGVWDYFPQEDRLVWDKWMYALYGVREEDFSGAYLAWQSGLHQDDKVRGDQEISMALQDEKDFDTEFRVVWPRGELRYIKAVASVQRDADGRPLRMTGINYDITERKKTEAQLAAAHEELARQSEERAAELVVANDELTFQNEEKGKRAVELVVANDELTFQNEEKGKRAVELTSARDDAEAANLAKSRFLATMSHEIRTPMNGILGMAQVLLQPNIAEADRLDYAGTIYSSGQTLMRLLNDILDLSKIEAGKVDLEAIALQPAQLLSETRSLFKPTADLKGLKLDVNWSGPVGTYLGDPHRLSQMLSNLVGNAIKFTSQGSIHVEAAEVACIDDDATLEFSVSDSGVGIAPDKLELLFQNFSQVDSSTTRNYGGTGLGLSIVRTLAQLMGGEVGVQSEVGAGSRFWFRIRARRLQGASHGAVQSSGMVAPDPGALITFDARVLVVEDNLQNQKVALALLKLLGASVSLAQNGQQALLMSRSVDLILMDLEMPLLDGYQATQQIRQWELSTKQPRRPIIALTASAFAEDRQRCLQAGMDEVMTKPMELNVLTATLRRWLPGAVSEPVATAASSEPAKVLDVARAQGLMHELEPLLENLQYKAFARFKDLQELARATALAPLLSRADAALQAYQFGVALAELQKLIANPAWQQGEPIESE